MSCQDKAAFDDYWESAGQLHGDDVIMETLPTVSLVNAL